MTSNKNKEDRRLRPFDKPFGPELSAEGLRDTAGQGGQEKGLPMVGIAFTLCSKLLPAVCVAG